MDTENEDTSNSLADDLSAAWDADESTEDSSDGIELSGAGEGSETGSEVPEDVRGADGQFQSAGSEAGQPGAADEGAGQPADDGGVQGLENARNLVEDAAPSAGAPVSWNATARETWKDIPKEAQAYIAQREQEMEQGIQKYASNAQRAQQMDQVMQPYGQYFAMNGGAGNTVKDLLARGATMQMGAPAQKAQMIADMIQQYGVDIGALDNLLVGKPVDPGMQQTSEVQQAIQQAMQPYQQFMQGQQQQHQNTVTAQKNAITSDVDAFARDPKNEFYKDVSNTMADILDLASNRNMEMSMEQAYERACQLTPEISRIMTNRAAASTAANKRRAGSSIHGSPGGDGALAPAGSMREAIEQAWDGAGQV